MEPGRDDREEGGSGLIQHTYASEPLWSPVVTTGKSATAATTDLTSTARRYGARS